MPLNSGVWKMHWNL